MQLATVGLQIIFYHGFADTPKVADEDQMGADFVNHFLAPFDLWLIL